MLKIQIGRTKLKNYLSMYRVYIGIFEGINCFYRLAFQDYLKRLFPNSAFTILTDWFENCTGRST